MGVPVLHYRRVGVAGRVGVAQPDRHAGLLRADGRRVRDGGAAGMGAATVRPDEEKE